MELVRTVRFVVKKKSQETIECKQLLAEHKPPHNSQLVEIAKALELSRNARSLLKIIRDALPGDPKTRKTSPDQEDVARCWRSQESLAEEMGVAVRTVYKAFQELTQQQIMWRRKRYKHRCNNLYEYGFRCTWDQTNEQHVWEESVEKRLAHYRLGLVIPCESAITTGATDPAEASPDDDGTGKICHLEPAKHTGSNWQNPPINNQERILKEKREILIEKSKIGDFALLPSQSTHRGGSKRPLEITRDAVLTCEEEAPTALPDREEILYPDPSEELTPAAVRTPEHPAGPYEREEEVPAARARSKKQDPSQVEWRNSIELKIGIYDMNGNPLPNIFQYFKTHDAKALDRPFDDEELERQIAAYAQFILAYHWAWDPEVDPWGGGALRSVLRAVRNGSFVGTDHDFDFVYRSEAEIEELNRGPYERIMQLIQQDKVFLSFICWRFPSEDWFENDQIKLEWAWYIEQVIERLRAEAGLLNDDELAWHLKRVWFPGSEDGESNLIWKHVVNTEGAVHGFSGIGDILVAFGPDLGSIQKRILDRELQRPGLEEMIDRHARFLLALNWSTRGTAKMWDDGAVKIVKRAIRNGNFSNPEKASTDLCLFYPPRDPSGEEDEEAAGRLRDYLEKYPLVKRFLDWRWQGTYWRDGHGTPKQEYAGYSDGILQHFQDRFIRQRKARGKSASQDDFLEIMAKRWLPTKRQETGSSGGADSPPHSAPRSVGDLQVELLGCAECEQFHRSAYWCRQLNQHVNFVKACPQDSEWS